MGEVLVVASIVLFATVAVVVAYVVSEARRRARVERAMPETRGR